MWSNTLHRVHFDQSTQRALNFIITISGRNLETTFDLSYEQLSATTKGTDPKVAIGSQAPIAMRTH